MFSKGFLLRVLVIVLIMSLGRGCLQAYEYQDASGFCQPCYYRCLTCQDGTQNCTSCNEEYYMDSASGSCLPCVKGCSACSSSTDCELCNQGFYLTDNGTCEVCVVGGAICTVSITSSCQPTYFMLSGICARCLANCSICTGPTTCNECIQGYYLVNSAICTPCGSSCTACNSSSQCQSCTIGYYPVSGSNGCVKCTGSGNIIYSVASASCISCPLNCESCDSQICYYCSTGYYLSNDSTGCLSGGSILCRQSTGPTYTSCKVDMLGCATYSRQQYDTSTGSQVPVDVCLPASFSTTSQYNYQSNVGTVCSTNQTTYTFTSQAFYSLVIYVQLYVFTPIPASVSLVVDNTTTTIQMPSNIASQSPVVSSCGSYVIWNFQTAVSSYGRTVTFPAGTFLNEVLVESLLCSVTHCEKCTTNVDCQSCLSPYYLQFNKCQPQCDSGLYQYTTNRTCYISTRYCYLGCPNTTYSIQSQYLCQDCSGSCLNCDNATSCLSCKTGYYLFGNACILNCSLQSNMSYYSDATSFLCRTCPFPCVTCASNTTASTSYCLSCAVGYLYNGNCPLICPTGTFVNYASGLAMSCSQCITTTPYFCSSCSNESTCTSCQSGYVLYVAQCLTSCPSGFFNQSNVCTQCLLPCLECSSMSLNCSSCKLGVLSVRNSLGYCPANCPDGTYVNFLNNLNVTCLKCDPICTLCFGASNTSCLACAAGYFLDSTSCSATCSLNSTFMDSSLNYCSACILPCLTCQVNNGSACTSCVVGFLDKPSCTLTCNSSSYPLLSAQLYICTLCPTTCSSCYSTTNALICTACVSPYLLFELNGTCIPSSSCPAGFYNDTVGLLCSACIDPCLTCLNSGVKCLTCTSSTYLVVSLSYCVKQCSSGYYLSNSMCYQCSRPCSECSTTSTNCTWCSIYNQSQYYLYNNSCLTSCPSLYYNQATNGTCQGCVSPCLDCYNQYYCKSCLNASQSLFNKACVASCPVGTLSVVDANGTRVCQLCVSNCYTCSNLTSNCTSCNANYYFYANSSGTNQCLAVCPNALYGDIYTGLCQLCVSPCLTCGSYSACKTCVAGYNLFGNTCLQSCPSQYYASNQLCTSCVSPCERCLDQSTCTFCVSGLYLPYNLTASANCTATCSLGQYPDSFTRTCLLCGYPCTNCSNSTVCFACSNGSSLYLQACLSVCPNGYYSNSSVCTVCPTGCSACSSAVSCSNCTASYVLSVGLCYSACPNSTYPSVNLVQNVKICVSCSANCLACFYSYNCTQCQANFYLQDGRCTSNCSSFYYLQPSVGCQKCSSNCISCVNSTYCLQCFSSFMYNHSCILSCPVTAYPIISNMTCVDCLSPCLTCSSQYSCLSCIPTYFLYQSACISQCTNLTWTMVDTMTCSSDCPLLKYYPTKFCYSACPIDMVSKSSSCVLACGSGQYVSQDRTCTPCSGSICSNLFQADMKIVQRNPLTIVVYFNQKASSFSSSDIVVTTSASITISNDRRLLADLPSPTSVSIDSRSVSLVFSTVTAFDMSTVFLKLPYVQSLESSQALANNRFNQTIAAYRNWSQQPDLSTISQIMAFIGLAVLLINLWSASGNYQHIMDIAQLFFFLSYMEIDYPFALQSFYQGFRPSVLGLRLSILAPEIYSFSPSKFIKFDTDISLLRNCGLTLILGLAIGLLFLVVILVNKLKKDAPEGQSSILTLIRKAHKRIFFRYLNDYLFLGMLWTGVFSVATFRNSPNSYTYFTYAASVMALTTIILSVTYIFFVVLSALKQKKPDFASIEGLVEDLETDCSTLGLMHTPIIYLRKLLLIFVVGLYSQQPVYSLALLLILSILILVILIFYKPFREDATDYICIAIEAVVVLTITLLILLKTNENVLSDIAKVSIGWFVVGIDGLAIAVAICWWGWRTIKTELLVLCCYKKRDAIEPITTSVKPAQLAQHKRVNNEDQPSAVHINKRQMELQPGIKQEDVRKALMDQIESFANPPAVNQQQKQSDHSQKEQFRHWAADQPSENASEHGKPIPKLLLRQTKQPASQQ